MVAGLDKFREYFKDHPDSYVIIGGTACDLILDDAGLLARATQDIDMILVIEALNRDFVIRFWDFIKDAQYERKEQSQGKKILYRFLKPAVTGFPKQIELFSKIPDVLTLDGSVRLTPIPVDDDLSNLSAILMDDDYYSYTLTHSTLHGQLRRANPEALICLKAYAYLNMIEQREKGEKIDANNIKKHKSDVFRLMLLIPGDNRDYEVPVSIKASLQSFVNAVKNELPDRKFFKDIGAVDLSADEVFLGFVESFGLEP